ncbi:TRAP transporter substrate-binding protein [Serpentinicella alkaliphila]|uniref:TRAP-type C4-dicarboxylate transport system substrate-binding protein n=1 Tax=Serpentinicella alkaliphila TaxID=1734049 RepID=A0A4R2U2P5_9FIRM|nr:TRAP transporter substrate-binding protein [Serpentinicella alkaliphila]QUH26856.1 TRAP transporter substrate-binding protein [Serpentinicella alkaliphila]TCQ08085.1 TRAP-type C4-dicarboxylate transport system substrate-binding protein [Serpentinicella alkaliphila]
MKKLVTLMLVLVLLSTSVIGCAKKTNVASKTEEKVVLKFGHILAVGTLGDKTANEYAKRVLEESNGRIVVEVFPAGQLGTLPENMEALEFGVLAMAFVDGSMLSTIVPEFGMIALPFILRDFEHAEAVLASDTMKAFEDKLITLKGIRPLSWHQNANRVFLTKKPIYEIKDFHNILVRSPEAKLYMDTFQRLGMKPTPIPWGEAFTALQSHIVDAVDGDPILLEQLGFYESAKYLTDTRHIISTLGLAVSEKKWNDLSDEDKEILSRVALEVKDFHINNFFTDVNAAFEKLEAAGVAITNIEDKQSLLDLFKPYWSEYAVGLENGEKILQEIIDAK